jgi:multisubunit Na+/H+ antiporter MnhC subunit
MKGDMSQVWQMSCIAAILLFVIGLYCVLVTSSLIRAIIAMELLTKSVTLLLILAGYVTGRTGLAQALVVTLIVIEVVVIAVAMGVVLCVFRNNNTVDAGMLRNIKG